MSWMYDNVWVFFIPIMIIMKIEYTIPGKTSLLKFALFIKFVTSHKRRHIFIWLFSIILRRTISSQSGFPTSYETPSIIGLILLVFITCSQHSCSCRSRSESVRSCYLNWRDNRPEDRRFRNLSEMIGKQFNDIDTRVSACRRSGCWSLKFHREVKKTESILTPDGFCARERRGMKNCRSNYGDLILDEVNPTETHSCH